MLNNGMKKKPLILLVSLLLQPGKDFKLRSVGDSSNWGFPTKCRAFYYDAATFSKYIMGSQALQQMNVICGHSKEGHRHPLNAAAWFPFSAPQPSLKRQLTRSGLIFTVAGKETKSTKPSTAAGEPSFY